LSLERLSFDEKEGKVCCRYGREAEEMDWFIWAETFAPGKGGMSIFYCRLSVNEINIT
jgi:hypothetical protein